MAAAERGSFLWMMFAITQVFLSIKLVGEVEGWITTLFGGGAAAAFMLALIVFRQEQRDVYKRQPYSDVVSTPLGVVVDVGGRYAKHRLSTVFWSLVVDYCRNRTLQIAPNGRKRQLMTIG